MKKFLVVLCIMFCLPLFSEDIEQIHGTGSINSCFHGMWVLIGTSTNETETFKPCDEVKSYIVSSVTVRDKDEKILNVEGATEGISVRGKERCLTNVITFIDTPNIAWQITQVNTKVGNIIVLKIIDTSGETLKTLSFKAFRLEKDESSLNPPQKHYHEYAPPNLNDESNYKNIR